MQLIFIFSKSFDIDMCPLPFTLEKMCCFISARFTDPSAYVQEQALQWLQVSIYVYLAYVSSLIFTIVKKTCLHDIIIDNFL